MTTERERGRCDDIVDLIDAALADVLSTGGTQHTYDPGPGQSSDWLDDWWDIDAGVPDDILEREREVLRAIYPTVSLVPFSEPEPPSLTPPSSWIGWQVGRVLDHLSRSPRRRHR